MISVEEITRITNNRNRMKKETYIELYKQISRKIRRGVESHKKRISFVVPTFVVGYPTYDRLKAITYLKRQLELGDFTVYITGNYEITITWKIKKDSSKSVDNIEDFPTLINLKKAANRYRRDAQND